MTIATTSSKNQQLCSMASKISNNNQPQPENSTLHLLQAYNNISTQDRDANIMLFTWMPSSSLLMAMTTTPNNQQPCSMALKISNNNLLNQKIKTTPSASKWLHQGSRQSQKCHALHMNKQRHNDI